LFVCRKARTRRWTLDAALKLVHARLKGLHYLPDAAHLVELNLQLVNLAEDGAEAGDLGVGIGDGVGGAVGLELGGGLGLLGELGERGSAWHDIGSGYQKSKHT
jgi:hypothetical protein